MNRPSFRPSYACLFALGAILFSSFPALALDLVWDDEGGSADKTWTNAGNWNPDNLPDSLDNLFIGVNALGVNQAAGANDVTLLNGDINVNAVTLGNGADIVNSHNNGTDSFELQVDANVTVGSTSGLSVITLYEAPSAGRESLDANSVTVNNNGQITLVSNLGIGGRNAVLEVDSGLLDLNSGGRIFGMGEIALDDTPGSPTTLMQVDGTLSAGYAFGGGVIILPLSPPASTLNITAINGNARLDLDGSFGNGLVEVYRNATLDIDVQIGDDSSSDPFNGTMNLADHSTLDIRDAWTFAGTMNVNTPGTFLTLPGVPARIAGGALTMSGGSITLDTGGIDGLRFATTLNATGGTIANSGHVLFDQNATIGSGVDFQMNGNNARLTVGAGAFVVINDADFNLDGNGSNANVVNVESGGVLDVNLGVGADEQFDGVINLHGGVLDVTTNSNTWRVNGDFNLHSNVGALVTVAGETLHVGSDAGVRDANVAVTGNALSRITAPVVFNSDADVSIEAGAALQTGVAAFQSVNGAESARFSGAGTWNFTGTTTFNEATLIDMVGGTIDLDNSSLILATANDTFINAPLTINAANLTPYGRRGLSIFPNPPSVSEINVDNEGAETGTLTVHLDDPNASWSTNASGVINLINGTGLNTLLYGNDLNSQGTINVTGDVRTDARLDILGAVTINTAGEPFRLGGGNTSTRPNTLAGGTISGVGLLGADSGRALYGHGTISADVDFDGNAELVARDGTLLVSGALIDMGRLGTDGSDGVLNMTNAWSTASTQEVRMNDGRIEGATITNDGVHGLRGFGEIAARVINTTKVEAAGGNLRVANAASDWDGASDTGALIASAGNLEINDNAPFLFNGTVQADANRTVASNGFELEFDPASTLVLNGGTYRSTHATDIGGAVNTGAGPTSVIKVAGSVTFESTSNVTLAGDLLVDNPQTIVESGATFGGGGSLVNAKLQRLVLEDGANVGVLVENNGILALGNSPGQTTGTDFQQGVPGTWEVELTGTGLNAYDRMSLTGTAQLNGALEVSLLGGFAPLLNDTFTILSAPGGILNSFALEDFSAAPLGVGLAWDVVYNATNVQLQVIEFPSFTADFDHDGDVDGDDLSQWDNSFGVDDGADADGDGASTGNDFLAWQQQFGSVTPSTVVAATGVPEPGTSLLALMLGAGSASTARRKSRPTAGPQLIA